VAASSLISRSRRSTVAAAELPAVRKSAMGTVDPAEVHSGIPHEGENDDGAR
jgi:hypothetical protein